MKARNGNRHHPWRSFGHFDNDESRLASGHMKARNGNRHHLWRSFGHFDNAESYPFYPPPGAGRPGATVTGADGHSAMHSVKHPVKQCACHDVRLTAHQEHRDCSVTTSHNHRLHYPHLTELAQIAPAVVMRLRRLEQVFNPPPQKK